MGNRRVVAAVVVTAFASILGLVPANADAVDGVIRVIDIRPILARHDIGANSLGLAYNPDLDVIYLSHGSDERAGFIYTLDLDGNLLDEFDFQAAYQPRSYPTSLTYDGDSGHLFVLAPVHVKGDYEAHLVEISPDGATIFSDLIIGDSNDPERSGSIKVRSDGLWQTRFAGLAIRHYSRAGVFLEDIALEENFPGIPEADGPLALASSFGDGFFLVYHGARLLAEVNGGGETIAEASTATLPDVDSVGRPLAVDSDADSQRIFLQVENAQIYVLSPDFLRAFVNGLVTQDSLHFACSRTPVPGGKAGSCTITADFTNTSARSIDAPVFLVKALGGGNLLLNADSGPGGVGAELTPDVGADGTLSPDESFTAEFVVGLRSRTAFRFFVDLLAQSVW